MDARQRKRTEGKGSVGGMKIVFKGYELIFRKVRVFAPPVKKPVKKKKKQRREKCLYKDKTKYTREDAAEAMKHIKNPQIRIYCCEFCQMWHLTHKKRNKW